MGSLQDENGPITEFPTSDLRSSQRFITSHNAAGDGVFVATDSGDHHHVMVKGKGVANIIYSTLHVHNGSVARLIDFAPGVEWPMHRAMSVDYGVVIEGEFELTLPSGESRIMKSGDVSVNRATMYKWRNCDDERSGRMLFVLLDCKPFEINGKMVQQDLGDLAGEYADR